MVYCCYIRDDKDKAIYQTRYETEEEAKSFVASFSQELYKPFYRFFKRVVKVALTSGGRESTAMIKKIHDKYGQDFFEIKIFADTGDDPHGKTTVEYLNQRFGWNIDIVFAKDENGKQINIYDYYKNKIIDNEPEFIGHALPAFQKKDCSGKFKIKPIIDRLKELFGEDVFFDLYMGLSHSEKEIGRMRNTTGVQYSAYVYPLIMEFQLDREICGKICLEFMGFIPERSACDMCFEKNYADWQEMYKKNPKRVLELIEFDESSKFFKKYGRGLSTIPIRDILNLKEIPKEQKTLFSCGCFNGRLELAEQDNEAVIA